VTVEPAPPPGLVGIVGYGLVGKALSHRLREQGTGVVALDPDAGRRLLAEADGFSATSDLEKFACQVAVSVVCVRTAQQVLDFLNDFSAVGPVAPVVCLTTLSPAREREVRDRAGQRGLQLVCAPVSGTSQQIASGDAVLLAPNGTDEVSGDWLIVIGAAVGDRVGLSAPTAAAAKLALNLVVEGNRAVLAEGFRLAALVGLDSTEFLSLVLRTTAVSRVAESKGWKFANRDFAPEAHLRQSLSDVDAMLELAAEHHQPLPITASVASLVRGSCVEGWGELDGTAVLLHLEQLEQALA
jgi:putative dehydrogenase